MKKQLVLFLALALCLGLTACGDTESDDKLKLSGGFEINHFKAAAFLYHTAVTKEVRRVPHNPYPPL